MIEEYLQEALMRERLANARRAAALDGVLRKLEPRRASPWRDAIHRLSKAISCLRLKRHTEGTALQEGGHQVTEGDRMKRGDSRASTGRSDCLPLADQPVHRQRADLPVCTREPGA